MSNLLNEVPKVKIKILYNFDNIYINPCCNALTSICKLNFLKCKYYKEQSLLSNMKEVTLHSYHISCGNIMRV